MDILDEIKEDLRSEQAKKFWANYGNWILGGVVALVFGTAVASGLQQYQHYRSGIDAEKFSAAVQMAEEEDRDAALTGLGAIAAEAGAGYKTLALFSEANLHLKAGDTSKAIAAFNALADNTALDAIYRELATIYSCSLQLDMADADFAAIAARLEPLVGPGKPWRYSALELQALAKLQQGQKAEAKNIYDRLAVDTEAPAALKIRAERLASQLIF
jgi:hypothetical protein